MIEGRSGDWSDAGLVATLIALDLEATSPFTLGGVRICGPSGPARDIWLALLANLVSPAVAIRRCPARIDEERLLGGLDLTASLSTRTSVLQKGLLSETHGGVVVFTMAENLPTSLGAQIGHVMDQGEVTLAREGTYQVLPARFDVILLDEGVGDSEFAPPNLTERCALHLDSASLQTQKKAQYTPSRGDIVAAHKVLARMGETSPAIVSTLVETAFACGIDTFRPVLFALKTTRFLAALAGRGEPIFEDANVAARLVFAHKANQIPQAPSDDPAPEEEVPAAQSAEQSAEHNTEQNQEDHQQDTNQSEPTSNPDLSAAQSETPLMDMMIETVKAALPAALMAALMSTNRAVKRVRDRDGRGSGDAVASPKRGTPVGSRRGTLRGGQRLHLIDTLRAAAPWQKARQMNQPSQQQGGRVLVRPEDIRIRRFIEKRETTIIFVVDASGSSAWQRLAEAKGAVQLILARAYQSRARVALVSFRNLNAEIILPPTKSLARARRLLGDMVGGGGTPLASGLEVGLNLGLSEKGKRRSTRLLILTDGQGNVARDGTPGRARATEDALAMAAQVRISGINVVHIDTAPLPRPQSRQLAIAMGAFYAPLPSGRSTNLAGELARVTGLTPGG